MSEELKLKLVARNDLVEIDGRVFSAQRYLGKDRRAIEHSFTPDMHLFDFLIGATDRALGHNMLIDANNHIWLIDHADAFLVTSTARYNVESHVDYILSSFGEELGRDLPKDQFIRLAKENQRFLRKLSDWSEDDIRSTLTGLLNEDEIQAMVERRTYLLQYLSQ